MKRLIALDNDEYMKLCSLATAHGSYIPSYISVPLMSGLYYVFDSQEIERVEKLFLLGDPT